jgi:hypothetical protein
MNRSIATRREDDDEVRGWIAEAGDPRVEPRPEHADQVRALLLERLASPPPRTGRRWIVLARIAMATAGLLLVGLVCTFLTLMRPANAWARITQAVQEKRWVHIVTKGPDGTGSESWISPRFSILAVKYDHGPDHRGAEYVDLKTGIKSQYVASESTIYRLPEGAGLLGHHSYAVESLRQLLRTDGFQSPPIPGTEIVEQNSRDITEQGKKWKQLEMTIRWTDGRQSVVKMVIRADPATGLPRTWDIVAPEGTVHQTLDYPDTGPADLMALGVPATAKRVDRVPGTDLNGILDGLSVGRNRFDDYCGYTWHEGVNSANVRRVWRKGHKWRVEDVQRRLVTKADLRNADLIPDRIPLGVDLGFWKVHEAEFVFTPMAICDGQTIWYYRYKPELRQPDVPYVAVRESDMKHPVYGSANDPMMPWPHLLPEQQSHRFIDVPTPEREFSIDPRPADGPPGTLLIRVRDTQFNDPKRPDLYRLWVDPEKNHLVMRAETAVSDPGSPRTRSGAYTKIAYVDTQIITNVDRSPSGFWYPTRVVRTTTEFPAEQVSLFVLDFHAEIPDALFRPVD